MSASVRLTLAVALACVLPAAMAQGESIRGMYFQVHHAPGAASLGAASDAALATDRAVLAWSVKTGDYNDVPLDGLNVVAVISAEGPATIGQGAPAQTTVLVDARASAPQQHALVSLVEDLAGASLGQIAAVTPVKMDLRIGEGCAHGYVVLDAGCVQVRTRRVLESDPAPEKDSQQQEPLLARTFYSYPAVTLNCSCSLRDAQGEKIHFENTNLSGAVVGGFSK